MRHNARIEMYAFCFVPCTDKSRIMKNHITVVPLVCYALSSYRFIFNYLRGIDQMSVWLKLTVNTCPTNLSYDLAAPVSPVITWHGTMYTM